MSEAKPLPLLPCPFCGSRAMEWGETSGMGYDCPLVKCSWCPCRTSKMDTMDQAIIAWNRRASPQEPSRGEVEARVYEAEAKRHDTNAKEAMMIGQRQWLEDSIQHRDYCLAKAAAAKDSGARGGRL